MKLFSIQGDPVPSKVQEENKVETQKFSEFFRGKFQSIWNGQTSLNSASHSGKVQVLKILLQQILYIQKEKVLVFSKSIPTIGSFETSNLC
jgi:hypothetical protein